MGKRLRICLILGCALSLSAQAEDSDALRQAHKDHRVGFSYHIQHDYDSAIEWYEKGAAAGLAKSEYGIGRILAFDREGRHDYVKALPWIIRAAEPRDAPQGYGYSETLRQANIALDWYCKRGPAEFPQSHPYAKNPKCWAGRGKALMSGNRGVRKNYAEAQVLLEKAVAAGRIEAQKPLARVTALNVPKPPPNYAKIAWGLVGALLFAVLMRILRWRQRLYWLIHQLSF